MEKFDEQILNLFQNADFYSALIKINIDESTFGREHFKGLW